MRLPSDQSGEGEEAEYSITFTKDELNMMRISVKDTMRTYEKQLEEILRISDEYPYRQRFLHDTQIMTDLLARIQEKLNQRESNY